MHQLHTTHADITSAPWHANDAETVQRSLQVGNSGLLAQLEEICPKVVQLSNKAVADEEQIWAAEKSGWTLEAMVVRLEMLLDEWQSCWGAG